MTEMPRPGRDLERKLTVRLDGVPLAPAAVDALTGIELRQTASAPALCELSLEAGGTLPLDPGALTGQRLEIAAGPGAVLFEGSIGAVATGRARPNRRTLRIRAHDPLVALYRSALPARHEADGLDALARAILGRHGLTLRCESGAPCPAVLLQHGTDDLRFLARQAAKLGFHLAAEGRAVDLFGADGLGAPLRLSFEGGLIEAEIEENALAGFAATRLTLWDTGPNRPLAGESPGAVPGRAGEVTLAAELYEPPVTAEWLSGARAAQHGAAARRISGVALGDAALRPGRRIALGLEPGRTAGGTIAETLHRVEPGLGWVTEFRTGLPTWVPSGGMLAAPGSVSEVSGGDDPLLRLKLDLCDGLETDWLAVALPGAGADKGMIALPEPGDRVLALVFAENPAHGFVLGGLYGEQQVPRLGRGPDGVRPYLLRTPRGQQLLLSDRGARVELRASGGSRLTAGPSRTELHSAGDLVIEAPGRAITIRAASIGFEEG
ncbi:phage baseplate assembly protein V [Rhodovulum sp. YEN HP10]|uniref:phage baseplate assembly protein V n=1 Tax=Rhodovulum sp. HP10 TaxID=3387397 RepID=UPI0039E0FD09